MFPWIFSDTYERRQPTISWQAEQNRDYYIWVHGSMKAGLNAPPNRGQYGIAVRRYNNNESEFGETP